MAQKPLAMELLKQILRLYHDGISIHEITRRVGASRNTVRKYLSRFKNADVVPTDTELADKAYDNNLLELDAERLRQLTVHFNASGSDLSKTGVTRQLLWQEYFALHPDGYSYSRHCYHLSEYFKNRDLSMHLEYQCGDMIILQENEENEMYCYTCKITGGNLSIKNRLCLNKDGLFKRSTVLNIMKRLQNVQQLLSS